MPVHYKGLVLETSDDVYVPAEDSFLLADNLGVGGGRVLDVGTGCGLQALVAARSADYVLGVDVNPAAVELARRNAEANGIGNAGFRVSDLFDCVGGRFDYIVFNPPYLPVRDEGGVTKAWAGGALGVELISRFIDGAGGHLNPGGAVALLVSSLNDVDEVMEGMRARGFTPAVKASRKLFFEELYVVRAAYKKLLAKTNSFWYTQSANCPWMNRLCVYKR